MKLKWREERGEGVWTSHDKFGHKTSVFRIEAYRWYVMNGNKKQKTIRSEYNLTHLFIDRHFTFDKLYKAKKVAQLLNNG